MNYTVTNRNIADLNEVVPFFHAIGVSKINLHRASLDGNAYRNPDIIIDAMAWMSARAKLVDFLKNDGERYPGLTDRFPVAEIGKGLCYMSSDVIGHPAPSLDGLMIRAGSGTGIRTTN